MSKQDVYKTLLKLCEDWRDEMDRNPERKEEILKAHNTITGMTEAKRSAESFSWFVGGVYAGIAIAERAEVYNQIRREE